MLSIGKLAAGQAKYYLDQAEVRVDAVGSIGDGLEEYYAGGAEARGRWLGAGAASLGTARSGTASLTRARRPKRSGSRSPTAPSSSSQSRRTRRSSRPC